MSGEGLPTLEFQIQNRWTATALGIAGIQGDPIVLTYSFVADGTPIEGSPNSNCGGASTLPSDLFQVLDSAYGSTSAWQQHFHAAFADWGAISGISFIHEISDDGGPGGSPIGSSTSPLIPGAAAVRGDIRIGGRCLDGAGGSNLLGLAYYPNHGDIVIDTSNVSLFTASSYLRNVVSHEIGHAIGLRHSCPLDGTKLMERTITTGFQGPQVDDIRGAQRLYGDRFENNDAWFAASPLISSGPLPFGPTTIENLSTDSQGDEDHFSFTVSGPGSIAITVTPTGGSYLEGAEGAGQCAASALVMADSVNDLRLDLLDATGGFLRSASTSPAGQSEMLYATNKSMGQTSFIVRVSNQSTVDDVQAYRLTVDIDPLPDAWIVDSSAPPGGNGTLQAPLQNIDEAIFCAVDGDVISVLPGSYFLPGPPVFDFMGKNIVVQSTQGPAVTTISTTGVAGVRFANGESETAVLHGFSVSSSFDAIDCLNGASPTISNCLLSTGSDTGVSCSSASPTFINCVMGGGFEGVAVDGGSNPTFINCTISGGQQNYGLGVFASTATLVNTIVWSDFGPMASGPPIMESQGGSAQASFCNIGQVGGIWPGSGNINQNPLFVTGSYRLQALSPSRDTGTFNAAPGVLPTLAIDGNFRINDVPDMGPFEYFPPCGPPPLITCSPGGAGNVAYNFPGTDEDLFLFTFVSGALDPLAQHKAAQASNWVGISLLSLGGTFSSAPPIILASATPQCAPPPLLSAIHVDLCQFIPLIDLGALPAITPLGASLNFQYPGGFGGLAILVQGFALSDHSNNGFFAASPALQLTFN